MKSGSSSKENGGESVPAENPESAPAENPTLSIKMPALIPSSVSGSTDNEQIDSSPSLLFGFHPPTTPWSTNQDRNLHHNERYQTIQAWKVAAKLAYRSVVNKEGLPAARVPGIVHVSIPFGVNRRRDPHNYCGTVVKAIIDGLVLGGAWPDDTPEYVTHLEPELRVGNRVIVTILAASTYVLDDNGWRVVE